MFRAIEESSRCHVSGTMSFLLQRYRILLLDGLNLMTMAGGLPSFCFLYAVGPCFYPWFLTVVGERQSHGLLVTFAGDTFQSDVRLMLSREQGTMQSSQYMRKGQSR